MVLYTELAVSKYGEEVYILHKPSNKQMVCDLRGEKIRGDDIALEPKEVRFLVWQQSQKPMSESAARSKFDKLDK